MKPYFAKLDRRGAGSGGPLLPHAEEDPHTTGFLEGFDKAVLVADRRDLTPLAESLQSNYSYLSPVKLKNEVYAFKEPAVSASCHTRCCSGADEAYSFMCIVL